MTKIYTKRGDRGQTDLFGGERVAKNHIRVAAYGAVDEANSVIGWVRSAEVLPEQVRTHLHGIMSDMFDLGAELATAPKDSAQRMLDKKLDNRVNAHRIHLLESWIDEAQASLPPLTTFILPTGSEGSSRLQVARAVVRRAERHVVDLLESGETVRELALIYLNRLSDLLFVWARLANHLAHIDEVQWLSAKSD